MDFPYNFLLSANHPTNSQYQSSLSDGHRNLGGYRDLGGQNGRDGILTIDRLSAIKLLTNLNTNMRRDIRKTLSSSSLLECPICTDGKQYKGVRGLAIHKSRRHGPRTDLNPPTPTPTWSAQGQAGTHWAPRVTSRLQNILSYPKSINEDGNSSVRHNNQNVKVHRNTQNNSSGQNGRSGQNNRLTMSHVNMPTGGKALVTIPVTSKCTCVTLSAELRLITLFPNGNLGNSEYSIICKQMRATIQQHQLQEQGGGRFSSYQIVSMQKVNNCCLWKRFREKQFEIKKAVGYVNERMLFHGTRHAEEIVITGFDEGKAKPRGMFGTGIYFAQHSSKSNQYAYGYLGGNGCPRHSDKSCYSCERQMLLCRVTMGKVYQLKSAIMTLSGPPAGFTSVEGLALENGGSLNYPEFVVYKGEQVYPEYLITYKIVQ